LSGGFCPANVLGSLSFRAAKLNLSFKAKEPVAKTGSFSLQQTNRLGKVGLYVLARSFDGGPRSRVPLVATECSQVARGRPVSTGIPATIQAPGFRAPVIAQFRSTSWERAEPATFSWPVEERPCFDVGKVVRSSSRAASRTRACC
jgi:hypothetical protein